nr:class I SAM-dependent methyltransferase [Burkholderiaceae bacterium]
EQANVMARDPSKDGHFDYVSAHGLFWWVPAPVREGVLRLIANVLTPMGVGYVSYNAYPGCRIRHLVREMMHFHLGERAYNIDSARSAWDMLGSVGKVPDAQRPPFFESLASEVSSSMEQGVNYLFHDDLSPNNQPFYLHEFGRMAAGAGLTYLGDAESSMMFEAVGAPALTAWLDEMSAGDWLRRQQYLDFATGTRFRRSLVCRARDGVIPAPSLARLDGLRFFSEYQPVGVCNPGDQSQATFRNAAGRTINTTTPTLKSVLAMLDLSPTGTIGVADLASRFAGAPPQAALEGARSVINGLVRSSLAYAVAQDPPGCLVPDRTLSRIPPISGLTRESLQSSQTLVDNVNRGFQLSEPWVAQLLLEFDGQASAAQLEARVKELSGAGVGVKAPIEMGSGLLGLVEMLCHRGLCVPGAQES